MKSLRDDNRVSELGTPELRLVPGGVVVDRLIARDPMVVDYYTSVPEGRRGAVAADAFALGTRALASAGGSATMAALNDHLQTAVASTVQNLNTLPATVSRQIDQICTRYLGQEGILSQRLTQEVSGMQTALAPNGEIGQGIREAIAGDVRRRTAEALAPLLQALNINDAAGPLGLVYRTLQDLAQGQTEIREQVASAIRLQTQRAASVQKGYDFEDFIAESLGELTSNLGDTLEDCSKLPGALPPCKDGDFVSTVDPELAHGAVVRITLEAKNRKTGSVAALCRVLESAKSNREALVAIGVLTNPRIATRPIAIYGTNKIIVHLPGFGEPGNDLEHQRTLLEMAYYIGRLLAVALGNDERDDLLDLSVISKHLEHLDAIDSQFNALRRNITAIENATQKTRESVESLRIALRSASNELKVALEQHTAALQP